VGDNGGTKEELKSKAQVGKHILTRGGGRKYLRTHGDQIFSLEGKKRMGCDNFEIRLVGVVEKKKNCQHCKKKGKLKRLVTQLPQKAEKTALKKIEKERESRCDISGVKKNHIKRGHAVGKVNWGRQKKKKRYSNGVTQRKIIQKKCSLALKKETHIARIGCQITQEKRQ